MCEENERDEKKKKKKMLLPVDTLTPKSIPGTTRDNNRLFCRDSVCEVPTAAPRV